MPNWCHCTLIVKGEPEPLAAFIEKVKPSPESLRPEWEQAKAAENRSDRLRPFEEHVAYVQARQPLTFTAHVPEPTPAELEAMQELEPCTYCGTTGKRPRSQEEADAIEAATGTPAMPCNHEPTWERCNACAGSGRKHANSPWHDWTAAHWGCKWDANFSGPFMALGGEEADVDESVAANGLQGGPEAGAAFYKFDTPWAPPLPWLLAASEAEPELELTLRWGEPGMGEAGQVRCVAGLAVEAERLELDEVLAPEELWY